MKTPLLATVIAAACFCMTPCLAENLPLGLGNFWEAGTKAFGEKKYHDAVGWYEKAAGYGDLTKIDIKQRIRLYQEYGQALVYDKQFKKAVEVSQKGLKLADQYRMSAPKDFDSASYDAYTMAPLQQNLADAEASLEHWQSAGEYLEKAYHGLNRDPMLGTKRDRGWHGLMEAKIGGDYWRAGNYQAARKWLLSAKTNLEAEIATPSNSMNPQDSLKSWLAGVNSSLADIQSKGGR